MGVWYRSQAVKQCIEARHAFYRDAHHINIDKLSVLVLRLQIGG